MGVRAKSSRGKPLRRLHKRHADVMAKTIKETKDLLVLSTAHVAERALAKHVADVACKIAELEAAARITRLPFSVTEIASEWRQHRSLEAFGSYAKRLLAGERLRGLTGVTRGFRVHDLKTWPVYMSALASGEKSFEVRRDDRDFQVGDGLLLREWDPSKMKYGPRELRRLVTYIFRPVDFARAGSLGGGAELPIVQGFCVMGVM